MEIVEYGTNSPGLRASEMLAGAAVLPPTMIRTTWNILETALRMRGYKTSGIRMPQISAFALPDETFVPLVRAIHAADPRFGVDVKREHGHDVPATNIAAFEYPLGRNQYIIGISMTALTRTQAGLVAHELLHVWENQMRLGLGTLTKELRTFLRFMTAQCRRVNA